MTVNLNTPQPLPNVGGAFSVADNSHRESSDHYSHVILRLTNRWRIILCRQALQWILQSRENLHGGAWRGFRYFRTRTALIEECGRLGLLSDNTASQLGDILPKNFNKRNAWNEKIRE